MMSFGYITYPPERILPKSEILPLSIAYLEDRVRIANGKPQLHRTQFDGNEPKAIEDRKNLDKRRSAVDLSFF